MNVTSASEAIVFSALTLCYLFTRRYMNVNMAYGRAYGCLFRCPVVSTCSQSCPFWFDSMSYVSDRILPPLMSP